MKNFLVLLVFALSAFLQAKEEPKPNVLFIAIDDMNDGITLFGKDRPFKTPNLEKLAKRITPLHFRFIKPNFGVFIITIISILSFSENDFRRNIFSLC